MGCVMVLSSQLLAFLAFLSVSVLALPEPAPNPAPQPFFGLLGRLLASTFSGEKEKDTGNCACRRTFHQKEKKNKDKDKDCSCDTYGAPVSYNAPSYDAPQSYEPVDSYGAPIAPVYGAPVESYGAPSSSYGAPSVGYAAPSQGYGAPVDSYGAPVSSYGAPAPSYGAPSSVCACSRTFHQKEKKNKDKN